MTDINPETKTLIENQIKDHAVLLYMKGTPQFPQCGFSARAVEVLTQIGRPFAFVNILKIQKSAVLYHSSPIGQPFHSFGLMVS